MKRNKSSLIKVICGFSFSILFLICLNIYKDFNISEDEPLHRYYGDSIVNYYLSFGKDKSFHDLFTLKYYGPFFDMTSNIVFRMIPAIGVYETMHLLCSLFSLVGLFYLYKLSKYWLRDFFSIIIIPVVFFTPFYFNSSFNQPKDIPFSSLFICSIYFLVRYSRIIPRFNLKIIILLSIAIGLTNAIRTLGVLLYIIGFVIFLYYLYKFRSNSLKQKTIFKHFLMIFLISFLVMTLFFPYMHKAPLRNYLETIFVFSKYPHSMDYLFLGKTINSLDTPRLYIPIHLLIKSPEYLLIGLLSLFLFFYPPLKKNFGKNKREFNIFLIILTIFLSIVFILMIMKPVLYDPRQFLFLYPLLFLISLFSIRETFKLGIVGRIVSVLVLISGLVYSIYINIIYHPSQTSYFNLLVTKPLNPNPYFNKHISNTQNKMKLLENYISENNFKDNDNEKVYYIYDPEQNNWKRDLQTLGLDPSLLEEYQRKIKFPINLRTEDKSYYLPRNISLTSDVQLADFLFDDDIQYLNLFNTEIAIQEYRGKLEFSKIYRIVR